MRMLCGTTKKLRQGSSKLLRAALLLFCALSQTPLLPAATLAREAVETEQGSEEREVPATEAVVLGEAAGRVDRRRAIRWLEQPTTLSDISRSSGGARSAAPLRSRAIDRGDSFSLPLRC